MTEPRDTWKRREKARQKAIEWLTRALYALTEPAADSHSAALVFTGSAMLEIVRWAGASGCEEALAYLRETMTSEA